jgi:hypothetical protein
VEVDSAAPAIKAYATRPGLDRLLITLINKGKTLSVLQVVTGMQSSQQANVIRLTGPAANATSGIELAKPEALQLRQGQIILATPAVSAAIVEIGFAKS